METVKIKGKDYITVNERVKWFRENMPNYRIITEITHINEGKVIFKAMILNENNDIVSVGHAKEDQDDKQSFVNQTSYVENCETSAVGRALAFLGVGIDASIASADEMVFALNQQKKENK